MTGRWAAAVNWRYVLLALGFAVLAAVRFGNGAMLWGLVFTAAAAINVWLAVHERRPPATDGEQSSPSTEEMIRSWQANRGSLRRWQVLACVATAIGAILLAVEPALSVLAAATTLLCLFRARRARRDTATLRQALDSGIPSTEALS